MPVYEYECDAHGKFETFNRVVNVSSTHPCPECGAESRMLISVCSHRFATPLIFLQDQGKGRGYKEVGRLADSGISPPPGEPYKTEKDVYKEEIGAITEV